MAFSRGASGLSLMPSCFELNLVVTVKSVQGSQVYLEWIGTSGSGMVVQPLEFSRISSRDHLLLRCDGNARIAFPMKQGIEPSS